MTNKPHNHTLQALASDVAVEKIRERLEELIEETPLKDLTRTLIVSTVHDAFEFQIADRAGFSIPTWPQRVHFSRPFPPPALISSKEIDANGDMFTEDALKDALEKWKNQG